ncbi:MAG: type II secretion system protein [Phycisphaeraceae bacterium]|nr:type II secretion system protein [Phycisphaeraceae bacterium]
MSTDGAVLGGREGWGVRRVMGGGARGGARGGVRGGVRGGFSLIELLVVIFIISILLGIMLPALPRARDAARKVRCGANLRSIGQSVEMYKDRYREVFPVARYMPPPWISMDLEKPPFNVAMSEFLEVEDLAYRCPGDKVVWEQPWTPNEGTFWVSEGDTRERISGMSYTYVVALGGNRYENTFYYEFLKQGPSTTPVAYDFDGGTFETTTGARLPVNFFHDKRNVLFVDGHVGRYGS